MWRVISLSFVVATSPRHILSKSDRIDETEYLARDSPTQPAAAAPSSGLAVLRFLGLLDVLQRVRLRGPRSQALPGRRLRRLAATRREKCGLGGLAFPALRDIRSRHQEQEKDQNFGISEIIFEETRQ